MSIDEVLEAVQQILQPKQLASIEQLVLSQSWLGRTYDEMAKGSSYCSEYIREVGSQLWQELSEALGQRVTKKNLYLVLKQHQPDLKGGEQSGKQQELPRDTQVFNSFTVARLELEFPSGSLPLGSPLYINRPPIEELAYAEISRPGCVIRIKAAAKMGKSSLLNQIIAHDFAQKRYKTAYINFQEADVTVFASLNKFLRWFCANITRQLYLKPKLDDYWDEDMGSKVSCKIYLENYLLEQIDRPVVLALDEVNRVFEHPHIAQDFLPMLRSWHEQAQQLEVWQKLRLVIVHSTDIYVPLKLNQSPFNIGLPLRLLPFSLEQVQKLAQRYGLDWRNEVGTQYATSLRAMVGGHPYLVSLALYHLYQGMTLEDLLQAAPTTSGIYSHHLRSYLTILQEQPQLASVLQQVVTADVSVPLDAITAHKLESIGLVQLDGNQAKPSCELYRLYFRQQLEAENWLDTCPAQLQQGQQHLSKVDEPTHLAYQDYFDRYLLSNIDELTHLANQSYFNRYLEATWQQLSVEAASLSLILCEIDHFEVFKDAHGLSSRDICLQLIGSIILDCVGKRIACEARYGNKKFAVILPRTDAEIAVAIADNIRESVRVAIESDNSKVGGFTNPAIAVSLGVASTTPSSGTSATMLFTTAEDALHQAKRCRADYSVTVSSTRF